MEIKYIYGNVLVELPEVRSPSLPPRLPTGVASLHPQSSEGVGKFHKRKNSRKRKSCLIRLTKNTNFFMCKNHYSSLFSRIKLFFFFSLLQRTNLNLKCLTTLQEPWTNWLAPTMWTLVNAKTDLDEFLGPKVLSTTWT